MKKAKRFLTGLLSAVMALSLCAMPAMADEGTTTTPNPVWTETQGSITIHKYEWNDESRGPATGEAGDVTNLPSKETDDGKTETPSPLAGATFTVYKVKDESQLRNYYDGKEVEWPTSWRDYAEADTTTGGYKLKKDVTLPEIGSKKTDDSGIVQFGKVTGKDEQVEVLPLGLYLVLETETPDSVKTACEPFFVSVPMTKVSTDTTGGLTDWLYDVHVFPKNSTAYGQAVLQKIGKQSGKNEVTTMQGYKFKLYKKNDDGSWTWIEKKPANGVDNAGDPLGENKDGILTTGADGKISVSGLTKGVYAFVETGVNAGDGYILDSSIAYVFKINDNGEMVAATEEDVKNAQYPETSVKSFDTDAFSGVQVEVKNYKPDFKKEVTERKDKTSDNNDADYGIGDDVPYTLTVNVPENVAKLKTFTVSDEMESSQLIVNDDIVVKGVKAGQTEETTFKKDVEYTLTKTSAEGKSGFTIAFDTKAIAEYAGGTITITYTAKLQKDALVGEVGNVNKADLKYSKKTNIATGEDDTPYDIHDEAVVYTFKTGILKKGDSATGEPLKDVEFTLYKKFDETKDTLNEDGTVKFMGADKTILTPEEAAAKKLNDTVSDTPKWFAVMNLTTNGDGEALANGLPNGEYKLVETKTHEGYNLLTGPVDANLTLEYTTTWTDSKTFENGKLIKHAYKETTIKNGAADYKYAEITIINRKGFKLPTTGGFGTLLFSGIGVLLVVAGVGVLLSLKKKNRA